MGKGSNQQIQRELPSGKKKSPVRDFFLFVSACFVAYLLLVNQFVVLQKMTNLVNPFQGWGTVGQFLGWLGTGASQIWDSTDLWNFKLLALIFGFFIFLELKSSFFSNLIQQKEYRERTVIFMLLVAGILICRSYLAPGRGLYTGDAAYFVYMSWISGEFIRHFKLIHFWHFFGSLGGYINQFYSPGLNSLAGFISLFTGDTVLAVKVTNLMLRLTMGLGVYLFIRELTGSKKAAFISGIACLLMHQLTHSIIYLGRYSTNAGLAFMPFIYYFLERYLRSERIRDISLMSIFMAIILYAHIGSAYWIFLSLGIYVPIRFFMEGVRSYKKYLIAGFFMGLGLLLCAPFFYSFILEQKNSGWAVVIDLVGNGTKFSGDTFLPILQFFNWHNFRFSLFDPGNTPWQVGYMGLSLLILSLFAFVQMFRKKMEKRVVPLVIVIMLMFSFFVFYKWDYVFRYIPNFYVYGQERLAIIFSVFLAFAAGLGYYALTTLFPRIRPNKIFVVLLFIVLLDLFPTTFQAAYSKDYGGAALPIINFLKENYSFKKKHVVAPFNYIQAVSNDPNADGNWRAYCAWLVETDGVPSIYGHVLDKNLRYFNFADKLNTAVVLGVNTGKKLSERIHTGLNLMNVKYLIGPASIEKEGFSRISYVYHISLCEVGFQTPALASGSVRTWSLAKCKATNLDGNPTILDFLADTKIDQKNSSMNVITVGDDLKEEFPSLKSDVRLTVLSNRIDMDRVRMTLDLSSEAYVRLAVAWYPYYSIKVNRKKVKGYQTLEGAVMLRLDQGTSRIDIRPEYPRIQMFLVLMAVLVLLLLVLLIVKDGKNGRNRKDPLTSGTSPLT